MNIFGKMLVVLVVLRLGDNVSSSVSVSVSVRVRFS